MNLLQVPRILINPTAEVDKMWITVEMLINLEDKGKQISLWAVEWTEKQLFFPL